MLAEGLVERVVEWGWRLYWTGYRGLLMIHDEGLMAPLVVSRLASIYPRVLVLATRGRRSLWVEAGFRVESPARYRELLGSEHDMVVIDVEGLLMPNLLAAVAEMVRGPGVLAVRVPCPWRWDAGGWLGTGGYTRYLEASLGGLSSLVRIDCCSGRVVVERLPGSRGEQPWPPGPPRLDDREYIMIPRVLRGLVATRDQAEALRAAARFARGGYRSLLLTGDRGRGKSAALGLILAYLIARKDVGMVTVTAPSPYGVQSLFSMLIRALTVMRVEHRVVRRGVVIGVRGHWFHVRYHTPGELYEPGGLLVVDEAAAIGPHRLRMLARRARRLLAASTIHGYEGSGRVLAHMVERILSQPMLRVELRTPIRYPPGDPLEDWLYETFVLRRGGGGAPASVASGECVELDGWRLGGDPGLARLVYEVLSEAHYRNEPDDLALMLDAPHYRVYALLGEARTPLAVAEVSFEWLAPREKRMLASVAGVEGRVARIVRIAVRPGLQRRRLGSRLLRCVEVSLAHSGADYVGAVYSRSEVIRFWLRNGYRVVYISPRFNRATGEKNIAVLKSIGGWVGAVAEAERRARVKLLVAGQTVYRDLPAEVVADILGVAPLLSNPLRVELEDWQQEELKSFMSGGLDHEAAWDAVWTAAVSVLSARSHGLGERHATALSARVVQGKPLSEVAALLGVERREAARIVDEALRILFTHAGATIIGLR